MESLSSTLCFAGVLLFLLGLATGFAIPAFRSSRIGLSAHLTGLQSGTFLVALGLMWPRIALWPSMSNLIGHAIWISLYTIYGSLVLAAAFGAGRELPIAGGGITTSRGKQAAVTALMATGSFAVLAAIAAVLIGWHWQAA
jgi:hydroxylaminobenzene mutase